MRRLKLRRRPTGLLLALVLAALQAAAGGQAPRHPSLSWAERPDEMTVLWSTAEPMQGQPAVELRSEEPSQRVRALLRSPFPLAWPWQRRQRPQQAAHAGASRPFLEPSTGRVSQHLHEVLLSGLAPGQRYWYRAGSHLDGWSPWQRFAARRVPEQVSAADPLRLLLVGDMGVLNAQALPDLAREVDAGGDGGPYDALLHVGDHGYDLQNLQGRRAEQYLALVAPLASRLPFMVAPGNHEAGLHNFSHYRGLFSMPGRATRGNLYYSLDVGPLHIMVYCTEMFFWPQFFSEPEIGRMYAWMEADLEAANARRAEVPWVIVLGHRPMYCVVASAAGACDEEHEASRLGLPSTCPHNNPRACRPAGGSASFPVEQLFHAQGVDLAVFGHIHAYERYWPTFNHTVRNGSGSTGGRYLNPGATVHVTSGAGGNAEMRRGLQPPPSGRCAGRSPWCAFQSGYAPSEDQSADYSFSRVEVHNATHLRWQQVSHTLGRVVDEWWLEAHRHGPFAPPA